MRNVVPQAILLLSLIYGGYIMLSNKVDKLILKAFLEYKVPEALRREDAGLAQRIGDDMLSYSNRLLMGRNETIEILKLPLISKEDKNQVNNMISRIEDEREKRDIIFFYRLVILAETIIYKYLA